MNHQEAQDKLLDYLYGGLSPSEIKSYHRYLASHPEFSKEVHSLQQLRKVYKKKLPAIQVSSRLEKRLFENLGIRRPWYRELNSWVWFRPALAGALVLILTIGMVQRWRQSENNSQVANRQTMTPVLNRKDFASAAKALEPRLNLPRWRGQPSFGNGLVSYASYGNSVMPQSYEEVQNDDIPTLAQEAELRIAQFSHQQALRMRSRGDFEGAANEFAQLIKKYPNYSHVFEAAAQRIDCLFRIGQDQIARQELALLGQHSPFLAEIVQKRWGL